MKTIVKTFLFAAIVSTTHVQAQTQTEDALKIDSNGNVGINTSTTPTEKLEVNGNIKATGNVNATGKVQEKGNDLLPKGTIVMWYPINGSTTAPAGWKICDGTDSTPDLRGRFIVGVGKSSDGETTYKLKDAGGEEKVTLSKDEMPSHTHQITGTNDVQVMSHDTYTRNISAGDGTVTIYDRNRDARSDEERRLKNNISLKETGNSQPHENRPPYYALYYIIKL